MMKQAEEELVEAGLRDQIKLMIGGGVTTPEVKDYVRADFQTVDAMKGVAFCLRVAGGK
jgi:methanogenic corrinoid protein MtbC1